MASSSTRSLLLATFAAASLAALPACSSGDASTSTFHGDTTTGSGGSAGSGGAGTGGVPHGDPFDVPIDGVTSPQLKQFYDGDNLFDLPLRDADGLGPLYTRSACGACHDGGLRGPGSVEKMVVVDADGITASADQSKLPFGHTVHPLLTAGGMTPIEPPPNDPTIRTSFRIGPPILGRGYLEAIADSEIEKQESLQKKRSDAIHGRVNHVVYASQPNPDQTFNKHQPGDTLIGRFGLKARIGTLDEFAADALQGDMGITSPLRPTEFPNPDGLTDDDKHGVDMDADGVNGRANYVRLTAIPGRFSLDQDGQKIFEQSKCAVCHVPTMHTAADYPIPQLADIDAVVYTDMLIHDMGDALSDSMIEGDAHERDWRTPPLIGLRFDKTYLHDGRVTSIEAAIAAHGGEASESVSLFDKLSSRDKAALLAFVGAL